MENSLTVVEGGFVELVREPTEILDNARRAAKALTTVIDQKPHKVMIQGKVYLEYEDWQTVAQFYGYTTRTGGSEPVEINGVKGAKATAELIDFRSGLVVGGAEAYCMSDEENWEMKPWFQLASMAQTRAGSKAIRNRMAWVVVLAGYAGTPAEEMIQEKVSEHKEKAKHWCKEHGVAFFKKGKMRSYAHPIGDTGEWCNELETTPEPPQATTEDGSEEKIDSPVPPNIAFIRSKIKDHMKSLGWGKKKWEEFLSSSKLPGDIAELSETQLTMIEKTLSDFVDLN